MNGIFPFTSPAAGTQAYNAAHIRQSPNLRQAIRDAQANKNVLFGVMMGLPSLDIAKTVAATDVDWIFIDAEHTAYAPNHLVEMVSLPRFVRVIAQHVAQLPNTNRILLLTLRPPD